MTETKTQTLADFLLARIAEDEAVAGEATMGPWDTYPDGKVFGRGRNMVAERVPWWNGDHIARHDPDRVLAECQAMRQAVIDLSHYCHKTYGHHGRCVRLGCRTLRALASVHSDHPDYRDEWKP